MNKILIIALFIITVVFTAMKTKAYSQSQDSLLWEAYNKNSYILREKFFENWRTEKTPITDDEYNNLSDIEKDVYDLFYEFYNPKNLSNLKLEESEYDYYKEVKYFVIYPEIEYRVLQVENCDSILRADTTWSYWFRDSTYRFYLFEKSNGYIDFNYELFADYSKKDSIVNFRPRIKDTSTSVVYFNSGYDSLLSKFIGEDIVPLGTYNIMQPAFADSLSQLKIDFLSPYIFTMASHWGNYWVIQTSPEVSRVYFSKNRDMARITYSFPYHANHCVYKKNNGKWEFVYDKQFLMW